MIVFMTLLKQMKTNKPKKEAKVHVQARLPASFYETVSNAIATDGATWQNLIEAACKEYLREREKSPCNTQQK